MGVLVGVDGLELRPHVPTIAFRFDSGEHYGSLKYSGGFRQCHDIVNDSLTIEVADSEQHLWLMIDQRHNAIVRESRVPFHSVWGDLRPMIVEPCYFSFV